MAEALENLPIVSGPNTGFDHAFNLAYAIPRYDVAAVAVTMDANIFRKSSSPRVNAIKRLCHRGVSGSIATMQTLGRCRSSWRKRRNDAQPRQRRLGSSLENASAAISLGLMIAGNSSQNPSTVLVHRPLKKSVARWPFLYCLQRVQAQYPVEGDGPCGDDTIG
ncbi:hypothetical protein G647_04879 [Cladophialophora carrionii CBS 160.54]|uniref:Uncharacterized protein n=1 Tax=Cladophialophora carrionii CBS 160.54 TaxID=1279043 RepID=V9D9V9_9EURO|nr:uncharacterized protein G647_04879 [Cladophialophora carrionii CBS 160.54]ETI23083.1 hypothetical protein G647_04879 [Cladophialophora carrionii CBS 160.54]